MSKKNDDWEYKTIDKKIEEIRKETSQLESNLKINIDSVFEKIREIEGELAEASYQLEEEKKIMAKNKMDLNETIKLDIGGCKYRTTRSTLTSIKGSMLEVMFSGRHKIETDEEGYVFIDRNGKLFNYILDFLRDPMSFEPPEKTEKRKEILREAMYFQIEPLMERLGEIVALNFTGVNELDGVFDYIGKSLSMEGEWKNPALHHLGVRLQISSSGGANLDCLLDKKTQINSIENSYGLNSNMNWIIFDLQSFTLRMDCYVIWQEDDRLLKQWEMQGSNDSKNWVTISSFINSNLFQHNSLGHAFFVQTKSYYRYFRFVTQQDFSITQMEFFGILARI